MATQRQHVIKFLRRKNRLFEWLISGIVIKAEWDNAISEAERLGLEASKHQILRYYQHYHIDELIAPQIEKMD